MVILLSSGADLNRMARRSRRKCTVDTRPISASKRTSKKTRRPKTAVSIPRIGTIRYSVEIGRAHRTIDTGVEDVVRREPVSESFGVVVTELADLAPEQSLDKDSPIPQRPVLRGDTRFPRGREPARARRGSAGASTSQVAGAIPHRWSFSRAVTGSGVAFFVAEGDIHHHLGELAVGDGVLCAHVLDRRSERLPRSCNEQDQHH